MSSFKNIGKTEQCRNVFRIFIVLRSARKYRCFQSYVCGFIYWKPEGKILIHLAERLSYFCHRAQKKSGWFSRKSKKSLKSQYKIFQKKSKISRNFRFFEEISILTFQKFSRKITQKFSAWRQKSESRSVRWINIFTSGFQYTSPCR